MVLKVHKVQLVLKVIQARKAHKEQQVLKVLQEHKVP
jgi:hypothetical protein